MSDRIKVTREQYDRAMRARRHVHHTVCVARVRYLADQDECQGCPTATGVHLALEVLDARPRDARAARRALHDVVCTSGCGPESDHADRTQTAAVVALRKYRGQE